MKYHSTVLAIAAASTLLLAACGKSDDGMTVGQKVDSAIATTEAKADQATQAVKEAMSEVKQDAATATANLADKVEDASITASVNAELAKDDTLSALKINVDTTDGAVVLKGTAPDAQARDRATALAAGVKGVVRVDNMLEVRG